jgi:F420-dependent oxidoreductase-like protein
MARPVQFGVFVPQGWKMDLVEIDDPVEKFEAMTAVAKAADAEPAIDSIWVYDHFHTVPEPTLETTFECWTITATLARDTTRVKVGQMVGCNGYRNPALYAKIASTVDVASHGRLYAGIGAGWYEHEWRAYGYGFPDAPERLRMLREACQVIHAMWTDDYATVAGQRYQIDGAINEPKGARQQHPPLWIGGGGEKVTLKLVAQYADACNVGGGNPDTCRQKLAILKEHCDAVGRNYDDIVKSTSLDMLLLEDGADRAAAIAANRQAWDAERFSNQFLIGGVDVISERIQALIDAGIEYVIVYIPRVAYDHTPMLRFAREVLPRFVGDGVRG